MYKWDVRKFDLTSWPIITPRCWDMLWAWNNCTIRYTSIFQIKNRTIFWGSVGKKYKTASSAIAWIHTSLPRGRFSLIICRWKYMPLNSHIMFSLNTDDWSTPAPFFVEFVWRLKDERKYWHYCKLLVEKDRYVNNVMDVDLLLYAWQH